MSFVNFLQNYSIFKFICHFLLLHQISPQQQNEGYLLFCPCMGRFGNQIDQLLGTLFFARRLNRTLVLPPLIEYPPGSKEAKMREFDGLFNLSTLNKFHRIIQMRKFMRKIADRVWPVNRKKVLCWSPRPALDNPNSLGCHPTEGNPFGPFWRHIGLKFEGGDEFFGQKTGGFDLEMEGVERKWKENFPIDEWPVLAFSSAPAPFPLRPSNRPLQQFLHWTDKIESDTRYFIRQHFGPNPFLGVHLRNGPDWENVCTHFEEGRQQHIFASTQCSGEFNEFGKLTKEACNPPLENILDEIQSQVARIGASSVFVASDWRHHLAEIRGHLTKTIEWPVEVFKLEEEGSDGRVPTRELAILGQSTHFIGNCVSSFTSFIVRQRHYSAGTIHRSCSFFAFPNAAMQLLETKLTKNDEL